METTTRTERVCVTCPGLGRDGVDGRPAPNYFDFQHSCEECRPQLRGLLKRIPGDYADLDATPPGGQREHVSGTVEAPLGVRLAVLNEIYTGPATTLTTFPTGPDQEGVLSAPRILWFIASAWLPAWQVSHPKERLPAPTVWHLADWLEKRLDWACNTLPALMADHAGYLSALAHRLDRLNNPTSGKPEPINVKIPCPDCDCYGLAWFQGDVLCTVCGVRMEDHQYHRWVGLNAALTKH
ncbi:hypothetical protein [Glycomyces sp. NPDC021274]|uniref:hypothetical protein n=1 Tax=Glycomyces sp. NPDC021274 TaxID=3155120 RepID=UPI0033D7E5BA